MADKFSPDVLLQTATQLYLSVGKSRTDSVKEAGSVTERRLLEIDSFVKFYSQLRDKLTEAGE